MNPLQAELQALRDRLAAIPIDALLAQFHQIEIEHRELATSVAYSANASFEQRREMTGLEHRLITARNAHENAVREAGPLKNRITEIERLLGATERMAQIERDIADKAAQLEAQQGQTAMIGAALQKLQTMHDEARAQVASNTQASAVQLLADAGIPGADAESTAPKAAQITQARQALEAVEVALSQAKAHQAQHGAQVAQIEHEIAAMRRELLAAQCDRMTAEHTCALGAYLPTLAALRRAEAAIGRHGSPAVDVEAMARAMLAAAAAAQ